MRRTYYSIGRALILGAARSHNRTARRRARQARYNYENMLNKGVDKAHEYTAEVERYVNELQSVVENNLRPVIDIIKEGPELEDFEPKKASSVKLLPSVYAFVGLSLIGWVLGRDSIVLAIVCWLAAVALSVILYRASSHARQRQELELQEKNEREHAEIEQRNQDRIEEFERFKDDLNQLLPEAVEHYFEFACEQLELPDDFDDHPIQLQFDPTSREMTVELLCPSAEIVPMFESFKFVKSRRDFTQKNRKQSDIIAIYESVVAGSTLAVINQLYRADKINALRSVAVNAGTEDIDAKTGQKTITNLASVRVSRDQFSRLNFAKVENVECIEGLGGAVNVGSYVKRYSKHNPAQLVPGMVAAR